MMHAYPQSRSSLFRFLYSRLLRPAKVRHAAQVWPSAELRPPLRRSFHGEWATAAFLVRAGYSIVWLQLNVYGFRLVRARNGHGTPQTGDRLLTMSIPRRDSTAAMLARAGFVVVLVPVNVSGFRLVLARDWHATCCS